MTDAWGQVGTANATLSVAAPTVTLSTTADNASTQVGLAGTATAGLGVSFSGVVNGSTTSDSGGNYNTTLNGSALGTVYATVTDAWGQVGTANATLSVAAPTVTLSTTADNASTQVGLAGTATAGLGVSFSGVVNGSTTSDSGGNYNTTLNGSALGTVYATVTDAWGQVGTANATLSVAAPTVTLTASLLNQGNQVSLFGTVSAGLSVSFDGVVSGIATGDSSGNYNSTMTASGLGVVTATVMDAWGTSNTTCGIIESNAPNIASVTLTYDGDRLLLDGIVQDEDSSSCVVHYEDYATGSTTVEAQGGFFVILPVGSIGTQVITFTAVDAWGLASAPYSVYFAI